MNLSVSSGTQDASTTPCFFGAELDGGFRFGRGVGFVGRSVLFALAECVLVADDDAKADGGDAENVEEERFAVEADFRFGDHDGFVVEHVLEHLAFEVVVVHEHGEAEWAAGEGFVDLEEEMSWERPEFFEDFRFCWTGNAFQKPEPCFWMSTIFPRTFLKSFLPWKTPQNPPATHIQPTLPDPPPIPGYISKR